MTNAKWQMARPLPEMHLPEECMALLSHCQPLSACSVHGGPGERGRALELRENLGEKSGKR